MNAKKVIENPRQIRQKCSKRSFSGQTSGLAPGFVQVNLVILPEEEALHFLLFCQRNPKPCPLLEVLESGNPKPKFLVNGDSDVRTNLPKYRVFSDGEIIDEPLDIEKYWRKDFITFLIGCSFTFEEAMISAGLPIRHIEEHHNVPMYKTDIDCVPAGRYYGKMVVSMRPLKPSQAILASVITSQFPRVHGSPVHLGDPLNIGIKDINNPDFGDKVKFLNQEIPVFWACGVTPQVAIQNAKPSLCITHSPGHMFVTDRTNIEFMN